MATPRKPKPDTAAETAAETGAEIGAETAAGDASPMSDTPDRIEEALILTDAARESAPVMVEIDEPPARPDPVPPPTAPREPDPPRRSGSAIGMVFGGLIAAGAGFALSQVVPQGWPLRPDATLAARVAAQDAALSDLAAQVAAIPAPVAPAPPDFGPIEARLDALAARLDAVEASVQGAADALAALPAPGGEDLTPRLAALENRLAAVEAQPPGTVVQGGDPAALAALRQDLDTLRAEIAAPDGPAQAAVAEVAAAAEAAKAALAETASQAAALRAEAEAAAQSGRMREALGRVRAALESGTPFATAVADLQGGGVEVPPPLSDLAAAGVPTLGALQDRFPEAARRALDDSLRADLGDTTVERLGSFLRTQVGARSLTPREGGDPDAVLSRAEAALANGRLAEALAELAALPDPGRAALADWMAAATQRIDATAAVAALAATLGEG